MRGSGALDLAVTLLRTRDSFAHSIGSRSATGGRMGRRKRVHRVQRVNEGLGYQKLTCKLPPVEEWQPAADSTSPSRSCVHETRSRTRSARIRRHVLGLGRGKGWIRVQGAEHAFEPLKLTS
jgi:hypothetical protein